MSSLIRGTTPTIQFNFYDVDVTDINVAYLYIKQRCQNVIEKDISTATVDTTNNALKWTLSQQESLALIPKQSAVIGCDWMVQAIRGRTNTLAVTIENSGMDEVIGQ